MDHAVVVNIKYVPYNISVSDKLSSKSAIFENHKVRTYRI